VDGREGPLALAFKRIQGGVSYFFELPFSLQLPAVAAVVLIGSALAPWEVEHGEFTIRSGWIAGADFNVGQLTLVTGIVALLLIVRLVRRGRLADSGGLAALGLFAVVLVGIQGIRVHDGAASIGWGLYLSAVAAVALLLGGLILLGGQGEPLPPPPHD
jgi:hypothetical protein